MLCRTSKKTPLLVREKKYNFCVTIQTPAIKFCSEKPVPKRGVFLRRFRGFLGNPGEIGKNGYFAISGICRRNLYPFVQTLWNGPQTLIWPILSKSPGIFCPGWTKFSGAWTKFCRVWQNFSKKLKIFDKTEKFSPGENFPGKSGENLDKNQWIITCFSFLFLSFSDIFRKIRGKFLHKFYFRNLRTKHLIFDTFCKNPGKKFSRGFPRRFSPKICSFRSDSLILAQKINKFFLSAGQSCL